MDMISSAVDLFRTTLITIPFMQLFLLIVISTLLLLFGSLKFSLLTNYLFTFYWGFNVNFGKIDTVSINNFPLFSLVYLGFGSMVVMLVLLSFRQATR
jgi:hypothetical protein